MDGPQRGGAWDAAGGGGQDPAVHTERLARGIRAHLWQLQNRPLLVHQVRKFYFYL